MENTTEVSNNTQGQSPSIGLSNNSIIYLSETGKWTQFLSILGFIFLGLIVVFAIMIGRIFAMMNVGGGMMPFPTAMISVVYIIIGAVYFFPIYYLFKFSANIKKAFKQSDSTKLENAFESLKSHYKYIGIMMIICIGFYLLIGIFAVLGMMMMR